MTADAFGFINRSYKTLKVLNLAATSNTTLADEAFKGCYLLDSLYLPSALTSIPYMAVAECRKTLAGNNDEPLIDRVKKMVVAFAKVGVTQEQIEKRLGRKVDTMTIDDFTDYIGIYNAIKQGESKIAEWFESEKVASDLTDALKGE